MKFSDIKISTFVLLLNLHFDLSGHDYIGFHLLYLQLIDAQLDSFNEEGRVGYLGGIGIFEVERILVEYGVRHKV